MTQALRVTVKQEIGLTKGDAMILDALKGRSCVTFHELLAVGLGAKDTEGRLIALKRDDLIRQLGSGGIPAPPAFAITPKGEEALEQLAPLLAERV